MNKTNVKIVAHHGRTAISVDGKVIPGMSYFTYMLHRGTLDRDILAEIAGSGIKIFFVLWQTWNPKHHEEPWTPDGRIDFTPLDEWMNALSAMSKDAWFIPRLYFDAPRWWAERHPDECVRCSDMELTAEQEDGQEKIFQASMASSVWRADVSDLLGRIVDHVENGPYGGRVLGYMINSAGTEEWVYPGSQQGRIADYSNPARKAFQKWLKARYRKDEALARAWNIKGITFARAEVPSESVRLRSAPAFARDPAQDMQSIDYDLFLSDLCAGNLLDWCNIVKRRTHGRRITGSFYGYLCWQSGYASAVVNNAHLGLRRLLDSPDIDFITGITSYDNRGTGEPGSFMIPAESIQAAGKLVFNEVDVRTHLSQGRPARSEIDQTFRNTHAYNAEESVSISRREFAHQIIHGASWWNFDMAGGWYSCRELLDEFAWQTKIAERALHWDMSSVSEMAVVLSASSPARQRLFTMQEVLADLSLLDLQCDRACTGLFSTGIPMDWWMTDDLKKPVLARYRLIYIFNAMYMSAEERQSIERLKCDGRTIVFCGAAGLISDSSVSAENASSLTGIRLSLNTSRQPLLLDVCDYDNMIFKECESALTLGTGALMKPCLEVDDPNCAVLGRWRGSGKPAFAIKECEGWRSIVCPAPINHAQLMRGIARLAGCHVWIDPGRIVFANRSLLAVHIADSHQPMRIHLPEMMEVTDLVRNRKVASCTRHFLIQEDIRRHTTFLYHLKTVSPRSSSGRKMKLRQQLSR